MKQYLLILLLALSITLVACTSENLNGNDTLKNDEIDESEQNLPYEKEVKQINPTIFNEATFDTAEMKELSNKDIMELYDIATSISFMFNVCTPMTDNSDTIQMKNPSNGFEMPYALSVDFKTYEDFKNYVEKYFDKKLSKEFLSSSQFQEHEGKLYICEGARGTNIFALSPDTFKVVKENDKKYILKIATPFASENFDGAPDEMTVDHYEYNDFNLEYVDGSWKFTTFPVIR